jgi:cysteine desulfuration protein SufE
MSRAEDRQKKMITEFNSLQTWEERYKKLIDKGKALGDLPEALKTEDAKVRGCQSQVWLQAQMSEQNEITLQADSDALIVKGLVAVLLEVYSGLTPDEVLASSADFLKELGFDSHLSPSRANGLYAMLKQIFHYATAFKVLSQMRSQK